MNTFPLVPWFRRRMLPIVVLASLVIGAAAPIAYHLERRQALLSGLRTEAARVAKTVGEELQHRPRVWRYDSAKLSQRLVAEGLNPTAVVIHDARGVPVLLEPGRELASATPVLWARASVSGASAPMATVWVSAELGPLWARTVALGVLFTVLGTLLGCFLYLVPMRVIRRADRRIRALAGELATTLQEEERRRIARDLHDGAGQALTAARLRLLALRKRPEDSAQAEAIASHLDDALDEIRRSTRALTPPLLSELGLKGALERHCETFGASAGLKVTCVSQSLPRIPLGVEIASYRIVQEALNNTARHAGATSAQVRVAVVDHHLRVEVADNGAGFDRTRLEGRLQSIRGRATLLGAELAVERTAAGGASIAVLIPFDGQEP